MGWNSVRTVLSNRLFSGFNDNWFYFVHSYAAPQGDYTVATSEHGTAFSAIVQHRNFMGVQFHPERSARAGELLLRNFLEWEG